MEKVCIAVIGCGTIANNAHLPVLSVNPGVRFKYAIDIIESRARDAKEKYGAEQYLTDYKIMLEDPEVEAVLVLTPNYSHATISIDCLNAGKHVFCEKPITINYELSVKMAETAKKNNRILQIGVCNRFHDSVIRIKQLIESGRLGEVYHVYCSFRSFRSIPGLGGPFTDKSQSGGGVLIDWGVHFFDLILYALGLPKITTVSADSYCKLGREMKAYTYVNMWAGPPQYDGINNVEEFVSGYIRTSGANISFNGAWAQNIDKEEMFVDFLGDKAGIRLDYGAKFTLYTTENGMLETVTPSYPMKNMFDEEEKAFFASVRTGEKTRSHIDNVLETAKLLDAVYHSGEIHREINF